MRILADISSEGLVEIMVTNGWPSFRAKQIQDAILHAKDYGDLSNIPKSMSNVLKGEYVLKPNKIIKILKSEDGTKKYLFETFDGNIVECVYLKQDYGNTICLSTQIGCRMGCSFCASTLGGLVRNLSAGEMLTMVAGINADNGDSNVRNFTNIVLMGSGEPLDNYDNVIAFLRMINSKDSFNVSMRNISLSTCGLVDKIYDLMKENLDITLCVSLHAPNDEIRAKTMPIAKVHKVQDIITALKAYVAQTSRRVVLEYCLIDGVNDAAEHCRELADRFKGMLCHFNVICINPYDSRYKRPNAARAFAFVDELVRLGLSATVRSSKGNDIQGACGQLRNKIESDK